MSARSFHQLGVALAPALLGPLALGACGPGPTEPVPLGLGAEAVFADHREVEVGFRSLDGSVLSGTLLLPPARGSYPAVVFHYGSDRWTRTAWGQGIAWWIQNGIVAFTYDKRGVGRSQGRCCPWQESGYFPLLGQDVLAAARAIAEHPEVDAARVGAWGFSQGGWVVPVAAAQGAGTIAFTIIGSGPTVTLGEELLYSSLTGDDECRPSGLSQDEIDRRLAEAGPSRFDPLPHLRAMTQPGLWIYGALDTSIPVRQSMAILERLRAEGKDFTGVVLPRLNHTWILDGAMCQLDGPGGVDGRLIWDWLAPRIGLTPAAGRPRP